MSTSTNDQNAVSDIKNQDSEDLASQALAAASIGDQAPVGSEAEIEASDELASTLAHLQNVIERNAREIERLDLELKEKKESLQSVFENDQALAEAIVVADQSTQALKERRAQLQATAQVASLKVQVKELQDQKKEIEETLSNHLVNYFQITQSKSFDTSDGDQWDFVIKARVKSRKK